MIKKLKSSIGSDKRILIAPGPKMTAMPQNLKRIMMKKWRKKVKSPLMLLLQMRCSTSFTF